MLRVKVYAKNACNVAFLLLCYVSPVAVILINSAFNHLRWQIVCILTCLEPWYMFISTSNLSTHNLRMLLSIQSCNLMVPSTVLCTVYIRESHHSSEDSGHTCFNF